MGQQIFDHIDTDNNGQVDAAELSDFNAMASQLITNNGKITTSFTLHGLATRVVNVIFNLMRILEMVGMVSDSNALTMDEITTLINKFGSLLPALIQPEYLKSAIAAAFGNVDINSNGKVTKAELKTAVDILFGGQE